MSQTSSRRGKKTVCGCVSVASDANPAVVAISIILWPIGACFGCMGRAYSSFAKTRFGSAIDREKGATFNFIIGQLLWWAIGFPVAVDHGYDNTLINKGAYVPWGSQGSGVYPLTLFLCIISTVLFIIKITAKYIEGVPESVEDIITKKTTLAKGNPKAAADKELEGLHRSGSFSKKDGPTAAAAHVARADELARAAEEES